MESFLEQFYLGIPPPYEDRTILDEKEYQQADDAQQEYAEKLKKELTPEQEKLLDDYMDAGGAVQYVIGRHNFISGFVLGCKIMMDVLK